MTTAPAHGFNTTKLLRGYAFRVYRVEWNETEGRAHTVTVQAGEATTRARALAKAKTWVLYFRRGGK